MKTQYIVNTVCKGEIRSLVVQAHDAREARRQVSPAVKIITVKRVVKLSEDKEVY